MNKELIRSQLKEGMNPDEYLDFLKSKSERIPDGNMTPDELNELNLFKLNYQRSSRIKKNYQPGNRISELLRNNKHRQTWMIITEPWCGDSAQTLPYIFKFAEISPLIDIKLILRDSNLDLMDLYLSPSGARSIPKLVSFNDRSDELFQWGARPSEAQELVEKLKKDGMQKEQFLEQLHLWYSKDNGKALETEFIRLLEKIG